MSPSFTIDHCNALAIRKAARHVTQLYDRHLAAAGLKVTQYSVLMRLRHLGPRTINELAAELQMDRTTMGRTIRPLERDGLVSVTIDPRDGRRRALALTGAGLERLRAARAGWRAAQDRFEAAYGPDRALRLRETLAGVNACDFSLAASATNTGDAP